ncbi:UNVERIFIED_CONTAM: hypothetical protein Sangu_1897600 [Sesamum angustifolium]|uniref:RNase H type-1 domain-containing protein n=1 Tax=Sesamum angustifolium TaxID=2727405 RepID=A0AAW2LVL5_9LAMI
MEMATLLGVRIDSMPAKYLGLPYFVGRNKRELFSYVRTRVWQRVSGWKEKMLSQADLRVSELLDSENGRWHKELIEGLFCPEDATLIQSIPLGQFNWADTMVFLWRLCREAIPTTSNLLRRRCVVEQACLTCGVDTETTKHVFLESYARQVRKSLDDAQFNWFAILCWRLWGRRNGLVMENKRNVWQPPDRESIKINFDAAVFDKGNGVGLGVIARDWKGDCLQVVNKLEKKDDDLSLIGCIIADIRSLLPLHHHTSFCFTRRLANQAAHMLAKSVMGSAEGVIPPVFLSETIRADAPLNNI